MRVKVIPFTAVINRDDTSQVVATQMQSIIDSTIQDGWEYSHMDSVQTSVAATTGCFGIGAQPAFITTFNVLIFKKP